MIKVKKIIKDENGVLNCFQPVDGGFVFVGGKEDAKQWIRDNIAVLVRLEEKYSPKEMLKRLLCSVLDLEMIEDLYVAFMKVREEYKKNLELKNEKD